jgi:RHS repeat-associated protein
VTRGKHRYTYDANGNVVSRNGYVIDWTSYNHPRLINGAGGESVGFSYNHNHERWRATYSGSAGVETTYFIGDTLEKVISPGVTDYRHYIFAGGTKVAVYSRTGTGTNTLRYIREDHLGSVSGIIDASGASFVKESFTAFGARRNACTWSGPPTQGNLDKINSVSRRGFTWHTALAAMDGRIQDAVTGRFLSPDPFIPDPDFTQSYNRYSYVNNNPLSYTDPSGFADVPNNCDVGFCLHWELDPGTPWQPRTGVLEMWMVISNVHIPRRGSRRRTCRRRPISDQRV